MKHIYNFFRMFVKDSGAHFTYDLGVSFMRSALGFFIMTVTIGTLALIFRGVSIKHDDTASLQIKDLYSISENGSDRYFVHFKGTRSDGSPVDELQNTTMSQYLHYDSADRFNDHKYNIYRRSDDGPVFITDRKGVEARFEFYRAYPEVPVPFPTAWMWISGPLTVLFGFFGMRQIKLSMKYPRSDIPDDEGVVTPVSPADETRLLTDGADENETDT